MQSQRPPRSSAPRVDISPARDCAALPTPIHVFYFGLMILVCSAWCPSTTHSLTSTQHLAFDRTSASLIKPFVKNRNISAEGVGSALPRVLSLSHLGTEQRACVCFPHRELSARFIYTSPRASTAHTAAPSHSTVTLMPAFVPFASFLNLP